jgi:hypothetical protein
MHRGTGRFVIERYPGPGRDVWVDVPDSGALRITRGPLGPKVITWAQRRGELEFTSERGITGPIHLTEYTVTVSTGQVIEPVAGRR